MGLLSGKVAVITGSSKGIGRVMSQRFADEGASVVCSARTAAMVHEAVAQITKTGGRAVAAVADASTEDGARHLMDATVQAFGKIDILVNNAGDGGPTKPVQDYTMEDWLYTINSCLTSSYLCVRFAVPYMIKGGGGSIINISSMAGRRGLGSEHISNQDIEPTLKLIWSYDLGDGWGIYGNLGVTYATTAGSRFVQGQAGVEPFIDRYIQPRIQYQINNGPPEPGMQQSELVQNQCALIFELHFFF